MDFGVKETTVWVLSLQLTVSQAVRLWASIFSSWVWNSHWQMGKIIPPRVIGKNKSHDITYVKAPCKVSGGYLNTGGRRDVWGERNCLYFSRYIQVSIFIVGWHELCDPVSVFLPPDPQFSLKRDFPQKERLLEFKVKCQSVSLSVTEYRFITLFPRCLQL